MTNRKPLQGRAVAATAAALFFAQHLAHAQGSAAIAAKSAVANGVQIAGIQCQGMEGSRLHIHQHLVIFDHGKQMQIPEDVGQVPSKGCLYWLHTHTPDGIIHIEAPLDRTFTLGDFFKIWAEPLSRAQVSSAKVAKGETMRVWVNGKVFAEDPSAIKLDAHADVVIMVGPPFLTPPRFTAWNGL